MSLSDSVTATIGKKHGGEPWTQVGAAILVDLSLITGLQPGIAATCDAIQVQVARWAKSPDLYAVVLDARTATAASPPSGPESSALAALMWSIDCFPKPMVALLDGTMPAAVVATTTTTTHRIGASNYSFAMPPIQANGALPLAGVAHALARLPQGAGAYLALTGHSIGAADALALGLLTHTIPVHAAPGIIAALAAGEPVDPLLDGLQTDPGASVLGARLPAIARCFAEPDLAAISAKLGAETGADRPWAEAACAAIQAQSPCHHAVALRMLTEAHTRDLRETLILSHTIARRLMVRGYGIFPLIDQIFSADPAEDFSLPPRPGIAVGLF